MTEKEKIVVFTGSGISVESGIPTYRSDTGLWHNNHIEDVCHSSGWNRDPEKVLNFWNERRAESKVANPNNAHLALARLEERFDVTIVTQNVDPLHKRAGSSKVIHIHGEVTKVRSDTIGACHVYDIGYEKLDLGDKCEKGFQLRPHICFFNEQPFLLETAATAIEKCNRILIVGTSLQVQPAASLISLARNAKTRVIVDPNNVENAIGFQHIKGPASERIPALVDDWLST